MTFTDAEAAEVLEMVKDMSSGYKRVEGSYKTLAGEIAALKQSRNTGGGYHPPSIRETIIGKKEFQNRPMPPQRGMVIRVPMDVKDILGVSRSVPQFVGVTGGPQINLRVRDLIPQSATTAGAVSGLTETSFTNLAAPVAEGAPKPKSDKTLAYSMKPIETLAHYLKISKQSYEDISQLAALIDSNLLYGLALVLEQQLLKGTGTSPNLQGLYPIATPAAAPPVETPPATIIDELFLAAAELAAVGYQATGAVMSAADYASMQRLKDTSGRYILGGGLALPQVVVSPALATGEWLVGDFQRGSHLYVREDASVQIASQNEDDFTSNKLTCLAELRVALVGIGTAFRKNP